MSNLRSVIDNYLILRGIEDFSSPWIKKFFQLMSSEWTRLRSFRDWSVSYVSKESLAQAGFFHLNGDRVMCAFCRGVISNWEPGDRPLTEHVRHFPRCPFMMEEDVGNHPIGLDPMRGPDNRAIHC